MTGNGQPKPRLAAQETSVDSAVAGATDESSGSSPRVQVSSIPAPPSSEEEQLPRELTPKYRLDSLIAVGGMGRVYAATQLPLNRRVAVKLVGHQGGHDDFSRRFLLEASISARLSHRNIVTVHDYGESPDGVLDMVMELLDGEPITQLLARETRIEPARACRIGIEVCRALRAAHRERIAHRDLKPGNVMVLRGDEDGEHDRIKVLDFGLVKVFQEGTEAPIEKDLTRGQTMLGSPRYMAPEQIVCEPVDNRADIYSLGVLLFSMLSGNVPFSASQAFHILQAHLTEPVPKLADRVALRPGETTKPTFHPMLDSIIERCMRKKPADRYQNVEEVQQALASVYMEIVGRSFERGDTSSVIATLDSLETSSPGRFAALSSSPGTSISQSGMRVGSIGPAASAPVQTIADARAIAEPSAISDRGAPPAERSRAGLVAAGLAVALAVVVGVLLAVLSGGDPPATTRVSITSQPAGAEVRLGGTVLGRTPLDHVVERGEGPSELALDVALDGYVTAHVPVHVSGDEVSSHVELQRAPAEPAVVEADDGVAAPIEPAIVQPADVPADVQAVVGATDPGEARGSSRASSRGGSTRGADERAGAQTTTSAQATATSTGTGGSSTGTSAAATTTTTPEPTTGSTGTETRERGMALEPRGLLVDEERHTGGGVPVVD